MQIDIEQLVKQVEGKQDLLNALQCIRFYWLLCHDLFQNQNTLPLLLKFLACFNIFA